MYYEAKTFSIGPLPGISQETIDLHLSLYQGYVKHVNLISEKIAAYKNDPENNAYAIAEMQRRLGFEFGGMRNHEYYFAQLEGGPHPLTEGSLQDLFTTQFGSVEAWHEAFVHLALTRGVGWAMLYIDRASNQLVHAWVDEQHLGQLPGLDIVLALDMWEHSFMRDYLPAQKKGYIDAFFANLNWDVVGARV